MSRCPGSTHDWLNCNNFGTSTPDVHGRTGYKHSCVSSLRIDLRGGELLSRSSLKTDLSRANPTFWAPLGASSVPLSRPTMVYGTPPNVGDHPENWSKIINFERLGRRNWSRTKNDDFSVILHFLEPKTFVSGVVFREECNGVNVTGVFFNDRGCIRRFRAFQSKIRPKFDTSSPYSSTGTGNTEEGGAPSFQSRKTM